MPVTFSCLNYSSTNSNLVNVLIQNLFLPYKTALLKPYNNLEKIL